MPPRPSTNDEFDLVCERVFRTILDLNPVEATRLGIHGENDFHLPDRSAATCEREVGVCQDLLLELSAFRDRDLSVDRAVDLRLARGGLNCRILKAHRRPQYKSEPHRYVDDVAGGIYSLILRDFAPAAQRAQALLGRLSEVPTLLASARENLENPPAIFTETASLEAGGVVRFIDVGLKDFIDGIGDSRVRSNLESAASRARAAMEGYRDWLEGSLMGRSGGDFAIGRHLYDRLLAEQHALPWTSEDLVALGQNIYQETMREMRRVASRIRTGVPWSKVVETLKTIHPEESDLISVYRREMERARDFVRRTCLAGALPEGEEIEVVETPPFARPVVPFAAYQPPAPFEPRQKGTFWVTTVDPALPPVRREKILRGHGRHAIGIQALHDAYPGHHLQLVRANQLRERKLRFLFSSPLFSEGWALYCEGMMHRSGFYDDDRVRLLQLKNLLWRACRVIIDVELQTGRMGFNDAATFLVRKAHIERPSAVAEVRRYCANPTQPICSVAGKVQIEELFEDARSRQGDSFDPRSFHDKILSHGTIPIEMIRLEMGIPRRASAPPRAGRRTAPASVP